MNAPPIPRLAQLPIRISRISIRHGHFQPRYKAPPENSQTLPPDWGEKIWVFNHIVTGQIVLTMRQTLKSNRVMQQLAFNGKKTLPAKIRKDYWRPMAMIQFPPGLGDVGLSVYHRLREFKRMHELSWGDEVLNHEDGPARTRAERGTALNNQKPNTIADLAAVLAGAGSGNRMWRASERRDKVDLLESSSEAAIEAEKADKALTDPRTEMLLKDRRGKRALVNVLVYWSDDQLRHYADMWSPNVTHRLLLESSGTSELQAEDEVLEVSPGEGSPPPVAAEGEAQVRPAA